MSWQLPGRSTKDELARSARETARPGGPDHARSRTCHLPESGAVSNAVTGVRSLLGLAGTVRP